MRRSHNSGFVFRLAAGLLVLSVVWPAVFGWPAQVGRSALPFAVHAARPDQAVELVEFQDFEGATFPPAGWATYDMLALAQSSTDVNYAFGRSTCEFDPGGGKKASAWAVGGGTKGGALPCGSPYLEPVYTRLAFEHINATNFLNGLRVNLRFKIDLAPEATMRICVGAHGAPVAQLDCTRPSSSTPTGVWVQFTNPILFTRSAGKPDLDLVIEYKDDAPDDTHRGVFIDNVRLEGLKDPPTPTPTRTLQVTNTPRPPSTPRPTGTIAIPTQGDEPTVPSREGRVHLPIAYRGVRVDERPTPLPPVHTLIEFGTFVDPNTGKVEGKSLVFQHGIMQLCAKTSWFEQNVGTTFRWQWAEGAGNDIQDIPGPHPLANSATLETRSGYRYQCVGNTDAQGRPIPLPNDRKYRVRLYLGGNPNPDSTAIAEIRDLGTRTTPTITPRVTATRNRPTTIPSATPEPTEDKPDTSGCSQRIENSDFERGPQAGWLLRSNDTPDTDISRAIVQDAANAYSGEWYARLGGRVNSIDYLYSTTPITLYPAERIVSASLEYWLAVVSNEPSNSTNDDIIGIYFINDDTQMNDVVTGSGQSEEAIVRQVWTQKRMSATRYMTLHDDWKKMTMVIVAANNAQFATLFLVEDVTLKVCLEPPPLTGPARAGASGLGLGAGTTGTGPPDADRRGPARVPAWWAGAFGAGRAPAYLGFPEQVRQTLAANCSTIPLTLASHGPGSAGKQVHVPIGSLNAIQPTARELRLGMPLVR